MPIDIAELIDKGPWPRLSKFVTALAALAIIFDGFDISIAGYAVPSIIKEWHLSPAALSPLLAIGLAGMTVGSSLAGVLGDRIGRRSALTLSVLLFGVVTALSASAPNLLAVETLRFVAACGIGGALPNATTISAEFTPFRRRAAAVMLTIVCVPLGGALAGLVARSVLPVFGWRSLFLIGGLAPTAFALLLWIAMPESPRYLARRRARLAELVRLLARLGHTVPPDATFADDTRQAEPASSTHAGDFFGSSQQRNTLSLWLAYFFSLAGVYSSFSWLPQLLVRAGFNLASSANGLAAYNWGGVAGVLLFVSLVRRAGSRILTLAACLGGTVTALALVKTPLQPQSGSLNLVALVAIAANGFFVNAVQTSLFALAAHIYPTRVRATGVGIASLMGRVGGICGIFLSPLLLASGRSPFFEFLALMSVLALGSLAMLRNHIPPKAA